MLDWQQYFLGVAIAAAALTGLLFVALSLHSLCLRSAGVFRIRSILVFGGLLWITLSALVLLAPPRLIAWIGAAEAVNGAGYVALAIGVSLRSRGTEQRNYGRSVFGFAMTATVIVAGALLIWVGPRDAVIGLIAAVLPIMLVMAMWAGWELVSHDEREPPRDR